MAAVPVLALLPALASVLVGLLAVLPLIDPLGANVESFRLHYDWFVVALAAFLSIIHVGIVGFNLGHEFDFALLVLAAVAVLLYYVGVLLTHAERNWFVGVRSPLDAALRGGVGSNQRASRPPVQTHRRRHARRPRLRRPGDQLPPGPDGRDRRRNVRLLPLPVRATRRPRGSRARRESPSGQFGSPANPAGDSSSSGDPPGSYRTRPGRSASPPPDRDDVADRQRLPADRRSRTLTRIRPKGLTETGLSSE
ncbi:hypothetical protein [Halovivax limisalsi]|uniref:hypothetical protein n=1 Tax=Halovivax limisalsi TaxID=1453760 RepID=UPI001FFC991A